MQWLSGSVILLLLPTAAHQRGARQADAVMWQLLGSVFLLPHLHTAAWQRGARYAVMQWLSRSVLLLLLLPGGLCQVLQAHDERPEFQVEHQVEGRDAYDAAKELFRSREPSRAGCSQCSSQDMDYCLGQDLLHDHCCCDRDSPERFPYIPHVCYRDDLPLCRPVAGDCEQFLRVDVCCCQPYLRPQWVYHTWRKAGASTPLPAAMLPLLAVLMSAVR